MAKKKEKMFLCDCQHFYALFANSFEGAAEEALCTNSWKQQWSSRQNFARNKREKKKKKKLLCHLRQILT